MTASSVSFRIARHTEDLAQTIHALSQRLVQLERRLAGVEAQLQAAVEEAPPEQLTSLANVDQLLRDCRELLAVDSLADAPVATATSPRAVAQVVDTDPPEEAQAFENFKQAA